MSCAKKSRSSRGPSRCNRRSPWSRHELRRAVFSLLVFSLLPEESTLPKAVRFLLGPASFGEIGRDQPCGI